MLKLDDTFELRIWGSLEDKGIPPRSRTFDPSTLHGRSLGEAVTLFGGRIGSNRFSLDGSSVTDIHIPLAFVGHYWLDDAADAKFDQVYASLGNLITWMDRSSITRSFNEDGKHTLEYEPLASPIAKIPGATIKLAHGIRNYRKSRTYSLEEVANLRLELAAPEDVTEIDYRYIRPFRYFLDLASGTASRPGLLRVANSAHLDEPRLSWFDVHAYGRNRIERKPRKSPDPADMLFTLNSIDFGAVIPRWYEIVEQLGITCDLLFSLNAPENIFVGNQMFNVASAAEGIHQRLFPDSNNATPEHKARLEEILDSAPEAHKKWLKSQLHFSNNLTFAQRLNQLIDHAGPAAQPFIGERDKWVKRVKDIRNQIAHALRERYSFETDVIKLSRLSSTVDALLRIVLLRELGFSSDECEAMVTKSPRLAHLRKVLPGELPEIF